VSASLAGTIEDGDVLGRGLEVLRELLPPAWQIAEQSEQAEAVQGTRADTVITIQEPRGGFAKLVVEARNALAPRDVDTIVGSRLELLRRLDPYATVLVVAPWLSPRTRELLTARGLAYLDLTGNAVLRLEQPALFLRTDGAMQDPDPPRRGQLLLRGAGAGRVVRLLVDVRPLYTATAIAAAAGVGVPYVSRLLATLDREALVQRGARGLVVDVDWINLLRRRAENYDVFRSNQAQGFVAASGARNVLDQFRESPELYRAITGSFVASQIAPVAAPAQLTAYVDNAARTADALGLLPADAGADVVLLTAYDYVVLDRLQVVDGLTAVGVSQLALDCLTGNGRMPAEGEAVLDWMTNAESQWRIAGIERLPLRGEITP